jgi:hypothetical protein
LEFSAAASPPPKRVFYLPFFFAKNFMKSDSLRERLQRHPFL